MAEYIIDPAVVSAAMDKLDITDMNEASIRQIGGAVRMMEQESGTEFIRFHMGVPGLPPSRIGIEAEKMALDSGVASIYPEIGGIPELKYEASRFLKAFTDTTVSPSGCVPTVGSMQGAYAAFMICSNLHPEKDTVLFIDPGFSVQKTQTQMLGIKSVAFDIYDYRAEKFGPKLESYLEKGNIAAIIYSNPNNPTWMCLCDSELEQIGKLATKYDAIVIEDLAYMAMDFRKDLGRPFEAPYQSTVTKYTDNWFILMSASKIFSYAGQRIAILAISDTLFGKHYDGLEKRFGLGKIGAALEQRVLYCLSSGTSHTPQYAMAAMLKAANDGEYNFVEEIREYGIRAKRLKDIFEKNGFHIIYDRDLSEPLGDGFFFTVGYKGMEGGELLHKLFHYGISAIVLSTTGSDQQGLRVCSSTVKSHHYDILDQRLAAFDKANK